MHVEEYNVINPDSDEESEGKEDQYYVYIPETDEESESTQTEEVTSPTEGIYRSYMGTL